MTRDGFGSRDINVDWLSDYACGVCSLWALAVNSVQMLATQSCLSGFTMVRLSACRSITTRACHRRR